ncbi:hypothetical protein [Streptomyces clavifer]|uniref:hypothetical protein n=1 Tax=Streptomyces clavifer TaxID=68188 RepID=UPI003316BD88
MPMVRSVVAPTGRESPQGRRHSVVLSDDRQGAGHLGALVRGGPDKGGRALYFTDTTTEVVDR